MIAEHSIGHVDLLKIDVEKAEVDVMMGIHESDWQKIDQVIIEVHDLEGRLGYVIDLLKSKGFARVESQRDTDLGDFDIHTIYATRHRQVK